MPAKEKPADVGRRRARRLIVALGEELLQARLGYGLTQACVATAAGISRTQVSRIERAEVAGLSIELASKLLAVVGLELSARAYPAGSPIRDAAHRDLLDRFRGVLAPSVALRYEVPLPGPADPRAWDMVLVVDGCQIGIEAETRPTDLQALQRRLALKRRDDPAMTGVILLLSDTRHNRDLMRAQGEALRADLPLGSGVVVAALAEGRPPGGSGVALV